MGISYTIPSFCFPLWRSPQNPRWAGHFSEDLAGGVSCCCTIFVLGEAAVQIFLRFGCPCLWQLEHIYLLLFRAGTLCPIIIMEVEHYPRWKETHIEVGPIFHFHDYGRKGTCIVTQEIICFTHIHDRLGRLGPPSLRQNPRKNNHIDEHTFGFVFVTCQKSGFLCQHTRQCWPENILDSLSDAHPPSNNDHVK